MCDMVNGCLGAREMKLAKELQRLGSTMYQIFENLNFFLLEILLLPFILDGQ